MTEDEIIEMATQVYGECDWHESALLHLEQFAKLVAAKEREALAQTQEPVAWMDVDGKTFPFVWNVSSVQQGSKYLDETLTPLYTHSRRTWVGLTVEEVEKIWQGVEASDFHDCVQPFAQAIGNILKEKNFV